MRSETMQSVCTRRIHTLEYWSTSDRVTFISFLWDVCQSMMILSPMDAWIVFLFPCCPGEAGHSSHCTTTAVISIHFSVVIHISLHFLLPMQAFLIMPFLGMSSDNPLILVVVFLTFCNPLVSYNAFLRYVIRQSSHLSCGLPYFLCLGSFR